MGAEAFTEYGHAFKVGVIYGSKRVLDPKPQVTESFWLDRIRYANAAWIKVETSAERCPILLKPKMYRVFPNGVDTRRPFRYAQEIGRAIPKDLIAHMAAIRCARIRHRRDYTLSCPCFHEAIMPQSQ
jgi:hypothetical protein